jgi:hypothetical protein
MAGVQRTFEGVIHFTSARAILFQSHYWEGPIWLPLSQIEMYPDYDSAFEVVVKVSSWICGKNELEEFTYYSEEDVKKRMPS